MPVLHRVNEVLVGANPYSARLFKLVQIISISITLVDSHEFVWTPCRKNLNAEALTTQLLMILKTIYRVIGGTDHFHMIAFHEAARTELRTLQLLVTLVVNILPSLA